MSGDFFFRFDSWIIFPKPLKITLGRKFVEISASQGAPPVSNLPQVSTTPVANNGKHIRLLKWTWRITIYLYFNSNTLRCKTNFSDWRFFQFATGVNDNGGASWAANISGVWGNWFMKNTGSLKSRDAVPLNLYFWLIILWAYRVDSILHCIYAI